MISRIITLAGVSGIALLLAAGTPSGGGSPSPTGVQKVVASDPVKMSGTTIAPVVGLKICPVGQILVAISDGGWACAAAASGGVFSSLPDGGSSTATGTIQLNPDSFTSIKTALAGGVLDMSAPSGYSSYIHMSPNGYQDVYVGSIFNNTTPVPYGSYGDYLLAVAAGNPATLHIAAGYNGVCPTGDVIGDGVLVNLVSGLGAGGYVTVNRPNSLGAPAAGVAVSVGGIVESTTGGFKYPGGSIQTSAGIPSPVPVNGQSISWNGDAGTWVSTAISGVSSQWTTVSGGINYSGGNVGIAAAVPGYALDLGANSATVNIGKYQGGGMSQLRINGEALFSYQAGQPLYLGSADNDLALDLDFQAGGGGSTSRIYAKASTGYVGIGTSTPGTKLDVNGVVHATGYQSSDSTAGGTNTITVKGSGGTNCTISFKDGLYNSTTCP